MVDKKVNGAEENINRESAELTELNAREGEKARKQKNDKEHSDVNNPLPSEPWMLQIG